MARKTSEKNLRKLRKNHSWIVFVIFGVLVWCMIGFIAGVVHIFGDYLLNSKLSSEYETICYMAKIYDLGIQTESDTIYDLLDAEGRPYFIKDSRENVLHQNGENTCSDISGRYQLDIVEEPVVVYTDSKQGILHPDGDGNLVMDMEGLKKIIMSEPDEFDNYEDYFVDPEMISTAVMSRYEISDEDFDRMSDEDLEQVFEEMNKAYEDPNMFVVNGPGTGFSFSVFEVMNQAFQLPIWMSVEVNGGQEYLVAKAYYRIGIGDAVIMIILGLVIVLLMLFVLVVMLVNAIINLNSRRKMTKLVFTDMVTRGHNWFYFQIKGEQLLRKRSSAKYNYAVLNVVFVKYNNFCLCHSIAEGEQALCKINELLNRHVEKREMAAHVSTSNYALLLRYVEEEELKMRILRIMSQLEQIDSEHKFGFQVGVNLLPANVDENGRVIRRKKLDIEQIYNNACAAQSTLADKDESAIAFFDTKLVEEQKWLDIVQEQQKSALEREEFLVYYQPKYDPRTNELRGAEALIRWESPEYGFITPGRFIPIFEKNGFITEIDHYMITHVAQDQKAWLDQGYQCVPVSVNVSRAHFVESDLAEQIRDMVDEAECPHEYIEIELTESAFFDDKNAMITTINKLKEYGFAVSMDDFGSGYSSLNSLKDMPLDVLKLDAEFFRGDTEDGRGEIVVTEAIKLAKSLNMRTVAEGVEIKQQVEFLAEQGCDMIQGYYFSKPVPKDEYKDKMKI